MNDQLQTALSRLELVARQATEETEKIVEQCAPFVLCPTHGERLQIDREGVARTKRPAYVKCPKCVAAHNEAETALRLQRQGVPLNLTGATFDNWRADDEQAEAILATVRKFADTRKGFLLLLGNVGTGKTHLAVAVMRRFRSAMLVKQSELLRRLRATYRDRAAVDPVDQAQDVGLLILDEMGFSAGGRDELPLLHDVLDYRHGNGKPTILTGNITLEQLCDVVGERMSDRLRESHFAMLTFGGNSHRTESRARYFWEDAE